MDNTLFSGRRKVSLDYFHDVVGLSKSPIQHNDKDRRVSRLLYEVNIILVLKKGIFSL